MARPKKNADSTTPWVVRDVPEFTRQQVRVYAVTHHMTMAQAIQLLVSRGVATGITQSSDPALGVVRDMPDKVLAELARRVVEETERRRSLPLEQKQAEEDERLRAVLLAQVEQSGGNTDIKKLMAEFLFPSEEPPESQE